ncbi:PIR Superfamily Protein, partial [Plasmodium malariae]
EDLSDYYDVFEFCENLTGIIKIFNNLSLSGQFQEDSCTIVKFWMYDRLFKLRNRKQSVNDDINKIILNLKENFNDKVKECNLFDFPYVKEDFDKMKSVYDYATNYNTIENYLYDNNYICNKNLKSYISKNYEIYINMKNNCSTGGIKNMIYCKVLEKIKGVHIKENPPLSCEVKHLDGSNNRKDQYMAQTEEEPSKNLEQKISVPFEDIIVAVIFPLLGIVFLFFTFYKFTPFKSWLKAHLLKKKINEDYEGEEYIDKYLNENYNKYGHHIHYDPL